MANDAVTLIKQDHRVMEQLFELMKSDTEDRAALLKECVARLSAHSWAEEERVYPAIVKADPPEEGQVYHGVEEHHEAEELLHHLQDIEPDSPEFDTALEKFVDAVKHHVEEEETKILPALAESVSPDRLVELGSAFEERRHAVLQEHGISDGAVGRAAGRAVSRAAAGPARATSTGSGTKPVGTKSTGTKSGGAKSVGTKSVSAKSAGGQSAGRATKRTTSAAGGGKKSGDQAAGRAGGEDATGLTRDELYEQAKQAGVPGRSQMNKDELARAIRGTGNRRWSPI